MVGERGFEPPTPWSRTRCSTRLSHSPTVSGWTTRFVGILAVPGELFYEYIRNCASSKR